MQSCEKSNIALGFPRMWKLTASRAYADAHHPLLSAQNLYGAPSLDCGVMERLGQLPVGLGWDDRAWSSVRPTDSKVSVPQQPGSCRDALNEGCGFHRSPPLAGELLLPRGLFHYSTLLSALLCFLLFFLFSSGNIWKLSEKH